MTNNRSPVWLLHELHAWSLNQTKAIASAYIVMTELSLANFVTLAQCIGECLHAYGIHSVTLQPESGALTAGAGAVNHTGAGQGLRLRSSTPLTCQNVCGDVYGPLTCYV